MKFGASVWGLLVVLAFAAVASGCGIRLFSSSKASIAAHTVFNTREECSAFVAQTLHEGMTLFENRDTNYEPASGDVFEGPARIGPSVFRLFDGSESRLQEGGRSISLNVLAMNLKSENARAQWDAACE